MAENGPNKEELAQIFQHIRSKTCFDCNARAPTWASLGCAVYVCLDCSSVHRNLGVHITFVRSTTLDSWTWAQIRMMKVGGNPPAFDYFTRNGGNSYLSPGTEGKVKYTSSTARSYKEELAKKVIEDAKGAPVASRVIFPGLSLGANTQSNNAAVSDNTAGKAGEEDFFDDWDKPASAPTKVATPGTAPTLTAAYLPSIGKRPTVPISGTSSGVSTPERSSTPTTTSSRTLNANRPAASSSGTTRKGALGATKISTSTVGGSKKLGGVKKATAPINFEEAERKAKEEEAKAKQMEEDALQEKESLEQAEAMAKAAIQAATASQANHAAVSASNGKEGGSVSPKSHTRNLNLRTSGDTERLGMGFGKLNMGAARVAAKQERGKPVNNGNASTLIEEPSYARSKFAGQKSISSDQYFERGSYDANVSAEAKDRLQSFTGQTSISSNQYFGREEEEEDGPNSRMGGAAAAGPGADGDDWAGDLEQTARDYYSRLMGNPDVQSGIESFRAGAMKLSQYLEDISRNGA